MYLKIIQNGAVQFHAIWRLKVFIQPDINNNFSHEKIQNQNLKI